MFCSLVSILFGQEYDGVYMEKRKIDKNNTVFTIGSQFIYDYYIVINTDTLQLDLNERDTFSFLPYGHQSIQNKKIEMSVVKHKMFRRTNKRETEIKHIWKSPEWNYDLYTSVVENDSNVWIHPIRHGFFRSLETCPFPYFRKGLTKGSTWRDSMLIGDHWSHSFWADWSGSILLRYKYQYLGESQIAIGSKQYLCHEVIASSNSELGESVLIAHYSELYGFVRMDYTLTNGVKIILELNEIKNGDNTQ